METGSIIINKIIAILKKLNYYFEYSFIYKMLCAVSLAGGSSKLVKAFTSPKSRNYTDGSLLMRAILVPSIFISNGLKKLFLIAKDINASSFNKKLFDIFNNALKNGEGIASAVSLVLGGMFFTNAIVHFGTRTMVLCAVVSAVFTAGGVFFGGFIASAVKGCAPFKLVKMYFIGAERYPQAENGGNSYNSTASQILFFALGLGLGAVFAVLPLRYAAVIIFGAFFSVFTLYKPKISYMLFFMGMLIIPNEYWNNLLILLSAFFYGAVFALNWFMDKNKGLDLKYLAPSLILFVLFCVLSLFTGFGQMDSVRVFAILLGCVMHSVLVINFFETKEDIHLFILILSVAIVLTSVYGLYQYAMGIEIKAEFTDLNQSQGLSRLFSTMANPNNDAESWVMLLPFIIAAIITVKCDIKRLALVGASAICLLALMLTYSRSSYLALLAAVGVFVLMSCPRLVPVGLMLFVMMIPFLPQSLLARVMTIGRDTSSKYRLFIWEGVFRMLKDFWTTGIGMGPAAFSRIYRGYANVNAGPAMHSHNVFLSALVETGIGGFIAFLAYLFKAFKGSITVHLHSKDLEFKMCTSAAVASLTAFCVFGLVEYVWFYPRVMLIFWLVSGLSLALMRMGEAQ